MLQSRSTLCPAPITSSPWPTGTAPSPTPRRPTTTAAIGPIRIGGDLVVPTLSVPSTATVNGPITVTDSTRNQGLRAVPESRTAFYCRTTLSAMTRPIVDRRSDCGSTRTLGQRECLNHLCDATRNDGWQLFRDRRGRCHRRGEREPRRPTTPARALSSESGRPTVTALTASSSAVAGTVSVSASETTKNQGVDPVPASVRTSIRRPTRASTLAICSSGCPRRVVARAVAERGGNSTMLPIPVSTPAGNYCIIAKGDGSDAIARRWRTTTPAPGASRSLRHRLSAAEPLVPAHERRQGRDLRRPQSQVRHLDLPDAGIGQQHLHVARRKPLSRDVPVAAWRVAAHAALGDHQGRSAFSLREQHQRSRAGANDAQRRQRDRVVAAALVLGVEASVDRDGPVADGVQHQRRRVLHLDWTSASRAPPRRPRPLPTRGSPASGR